MPNNSSQPKTFWNKPEGKTGAFFLMAILGLIGFGVVSFAIPVISFLLGLVGTIATYAIGLGVLGTVIFMALDNRTRNLVSYMYQSAMRKITGFFVTIDPMGILKNYISDLEKNLKKMGKQIGNLKGQMRNLKNQLSNNNQEIEQNLAIARKAKQVGNEQQLVLASRKAARLKQTNTKYVALHNKLAVLYRVLTKMHSNSEILLEDTKDQVRVKDQERKAIRASHSAMKSAMSIIKGDPDKRAMFDQAMQGIADDVANKVGEMERFMELSSDFMQSIDLQEGIFEEKGMAMLEEYEKKSTLMLLGGAEEADEMLDLNEPRREIEYRDNKDDKSDYGSLFE